MGIETDYKDIRVLIKGNYKIYYKIKEDKLIIHLVWDSPQNQESIGGKLIL